MDNVICYIHLLNKKGTLLPSDVSIVVCVVHADAINALSQIAHRIVVAHMSNTRIVNYVQLTK